MTIDNRHFPALLLLIMAIGTLGGAYAFQYIGGLQPCTLCLYQRLPWWIAGGLGILALALLARLLGRARKQKPVALSDADRGRIAALLEEK